MDVALIVAPYHLGRLRVANGRGPERLLAAGAERVLADRGHRVRVAVVELDAREGEPDAGDASVALERLVAARVRDAVDRGALPVTLAGNCHTAALGALGGLTSAAVGVVWFDAHADFAAPDAGATGLFGRGLAVATGACGASLGQGFPDFRPVAWERAVLVGARNLARAERAGLDAAGIVRIGPERVRREGVAAALAGPLAALRRRVDAVYLHVDLDALDSGEGRANPLATPGGLSLNELEAAVLAVGERFAVRAAAMTAYDPDGDVEGRVARAGVRLLTAIAGAATGAPSPA